MKKVIEILKKIPPYIRAIIIIVSAILLVDKYGKSNERRQYEFTRKYFRVEDNVMKDTIEIIDFKKIENFFGDREAKIQIVEYARFDCPYCVKFHNENMKKIKKNYIDTGKVYYIMRLLIEEKTILASVLPSCINDEKEKYNFIEKLYLKNKEWIKLSPPDQVEKLKEIWKEEVKTKSEKDFENCIINTQIANLLLEKQRKEIAEFKISTTPTFVIDGKIYDRGYMKYEEFEKYLLEQ
jgi:protein-disulfide isomerase